MLANSWDFFRSWFVTPDLTWQYGLIAIALAGIIGTIWLLFYRPPLLSRWWLWAVMAGSALISLVLIAFVQLPLQTWTAQIIEATMSQEAIITWLPLVGIPSVLFSGLVQEGAKMLPVIYWWLRNGNDFTPRMGMAVGAVAGAGLGIFEAFWVHSRIFAAGWTTAALQTDGFMGIAGFWERFFTIGFHIAAAALAGYGLAKGKGWQYFLIAAGLHTLLNYISIFYRVGYINITVVETFVAVFAVLLTAAVLTLRVRAGNEPETDEEPAAASDE